jgi:hypothetical protein
MKTASAISFIMRSWWVILFSLVCFALFEHAVKKEESDYAKLYEHLMVLQTAKEEGLKIQHALHLQVNSESDPAWIELTLMQRLGLVPEGHIKVFFKPE